MSMPALRLYGIGDLRHESIPEPGPPDTGQVRLRILAAGICGSDLHNYRTGQWIDQVPVTPGHEYCADVEAVGPGVNDVAVGDRVVGDSRAVCGRCDYCRAGETNLCENLGFVGEVCDGAFAPWCIQPAERLVHVSTELTPCIAALAEPLAVALHVIARLAGQPGVPLLIAGGGTIGALVALAADAHGLGPVYVAERLPARRRLLADICNATPVDLVPECVRDATGRPPRLAVEATGSHDALSELIHCVGAGSRIAMVGLFHGAGTMDANALVEREISLVGCSAFHDELPHACELLHTLAPRIAELIDPPIDLAEGVARYDDLIKHGRDRIKSIIEPWQESP